MKCRSLWHRPAKLVRTRTSRRFGLAMLTSSMVNGWCAACRIAALMAYLRGDPQEDDPVAVAEEPSYGRIAKGEITGSAAVSICPQARIGGGVAGVGRGTSGGDGTGAGSGCGTSGGGIGISGPGVGTGGSGW